LNPKNLDISEARHKYHACYLPSSILESDNIASRVVTVEGDVGEMNAVFALFFAGTCVIWALYILAKTKTISGMAYCLLLAAAFATIGWLDLKGLLDTKWTSVGLNALIGINLIVTAIASLYSPPSPKAPRWTQWAMLVIGALVVLTATGQGWHAYWR
jgi:hypothetical protein